MGDTPGRLLRLLSLLQARREWPGAELAERLDVTVRTVRRDVERLRALGYPVEARAGVAGYALGRGASLPPLLLDDEEAVAVAIGLRGAAAGGVSGIEETSIRALAKLEQMLPSRVRRRVSALHAATSAMAGGPAVDPETLTALAAACRDQHQVRFDYQSFGGSESVRTVEPTRLVSSGRRWYLVAWDPGAGDWRTFRADRIALRAWNGPRFTPRPLTEADALASTSRSVAISSYRYQGRFTIHASAAYVSGRMGPTTAVVDPIDPHSCTLRAGADTLDELVVWIAILGVDFEVLEPPELVGYVDTLVDRLRRSVSGRRAS